MSELVSFCDDTGDRVITTQLVEAVPREGEEVQIISDTTHQTFEVTKVTHQIRLPSRSSKGSVRVYVLLKEKK
jgi:hypothetical protein